VGRKLIAMNGNSILLSRSTNSRINKETTKRGVACLRSDPDYFERKRTSWNPSSNGHIHMHNACEEVNPKSTTRFLKVFDLVDWRKQFAI
jgi:hypothetical protein